MFSLLAYIRLLRVHHWIKNILIFVPLLLSQQFFVKEDVLRVALGFIIFSLIAGVVYTLNDIADSESDKRSPKKKQRPIALGIISVQAAMFFSLVLGIIGLSSAWFIGSEFFGLLLVYLFLTTLYSFWLKHFPIFDLLLVASFYLIRLFAGVVLVPAPLSNFIFFVTFFIALLVIALKRRQELLYSKSFPLYSTSFLESIAMIATAGAIIFYILDALNRSTSFLWSVPFALYAIFRYVYLVITLEKTEEPVMLVLRDPYMVVSSLLWIVSILFLYRV